MPHQLPRRFQLGGQVGQAKAHRLVLDNRLAKAFPLAGVAQRAIQRRARHAQRLGGNADAPGFQIGQGNAVAIALRAQPLAGGNAALVKHNLAGVTGRLTQLVLHPRHLITRRGGGHNKRRQAFFAGFRVGDGNHDGDVGVLARGDELLGAVEHIVIAIAHRAGAQGAGVRTGLRLGQAKRPQPLATGHRPQKRLFLPRIAKPLNRPAAHRIGDGNNGGRRAITHGDFLQRHRRRQSIQTRPAPLGGYGNAIQPQLAQLAQCIGRELMRLSPTRRIRRQLARGKIRQGVAQQLMFGRQNHALAILSSNRSK